jgi:1,4-alpha-glucan branching enzyme
MLYAFTENFVLPVSHDEVVYGKRSVLGKMPGDEWQRFANARAFFAYMFAHPGKKLAFMGAEVGQYEEWDHDSAVRWDLLDHKFHHGLHTLVRDLNWFYRANPALHQVDFHWEGFQWVDFHDADAAVIAFLRFAEDRSNPILVCCNFTPVVREAYEFGVPRPGFYEEIFNTDAERYGGSNVGNAPGVLSTPSPKHGFEQSIRLTLPPLAVVFLRRHD